MKWQTIDTYPFPNDSYDAGPDVLVWRKGQCLNIAQGRKDQYGTIDFHEASSGNLIMPSHWMALPEPPEET